MDGYAIPVLYCIGIGVFLWLRKIEGRIVPYREALISKGVYPLRKSSQTATIDPPTFIWILRTFNETSRLYRMIQYFHSHYGFKQTVIIPNESKVSPQNEIPILEFFQVTEIAVAIQGATHIFSEAGVAKAAATTAERAQKPLLLFIHDEESDKEFRGILNIHRSLTPIYTSRWIQTIYGDIGTPLSANLPAGLYEGVSDTYHSGEDCLFLPRQSVEIPGYCGETPCLRFFVFGFHCTNNQIQIHGNRHSLYNGLCPYELRGRAKSRRLRNSYCGSADPHPGGDSTGCLYLCRGHKPRGLAPAHPAFEGGRTFL